MVSDEIVVDTAALRAVGESLIAQARAVTDRASSRLAKNHDEYGSSDLCDAAQQFGSRWTRGLNQIATDLEARGRVVIAAAEEYEAAEANVAAGAAGAGGATTIVRPQ